MSNRGRTREVTVNDRLAAMLDGLHPRWVVEAESTRVIAGAAAAAPDVLIRLSSGAPVVVEIEYVPASEVEKDAAQRLGMDLAATGDPIEQAFAIRLPTELASVPQSRLDGVLAAAQLEYCLLSLADGDAPSRFPASGWLRGGVRDLARLIECVAVSERRVARALSAFEDGVAQAASIAVVALEEQASAALAEMCAALHQEQNEQTIRMAMTIVTNALVFHSAIAPVHGDIPSLEQLRDGGDLGPSDLLRAWSAILEINYWPIFEIARRVLIPVPVEVGRRILQRLSLVADELVGLGIATTQDMTGQIFGRLIADRKFLATFYTRPSSASLLAELAVSRLSCDFGDEAGLQNLRIADLACGTGALLSAAYGQVAARCRREGVDDRSLHPTFMEDVLVGADIMPAAVHVTASMLSSVHPSVPFGDTNIHLMPYGETSGVADKRGVASIGSLELIDDTESASLFGAGRSVAAGSGGRSTDDSERRFVLDHGSADVVIMNPPFTRTVGQEGERVGVPRPAFAGFGNSEAEQTAMSERLKRVSLYQGREESAGHGHAGLASYFIDLAHAKIKPEGTVAFVLPATFCTASAWKKARTLLAEAYEDIVVVSLAAHGSTDRAFSDDTAMAEVLVVATRRREARRVRSSALAVDGNGRAEVRGEVCWAALADRPQHSLQATETARASAPEFEVMDRLEQHSLQATETARALQAGPRAGGDYGSLRIGDERVGVWFRGDMTDGGYGQVSSFDVALSAAALTRGDLRLPRMDPRTIPISRLSSLGRVGPGNAAIGVLTGNEAALDRGTGAYAAPFRIWESDFGSETWQAATYPVLWRHSARSGRESRLEVMPDSYAELQAGADESDGRRVWAQAASRLHANLDFRLNSQPLGFCWTPRCVGGMAWPSFFADSPSWSVPLLLWGNTTLGLLARWWVSSRQQQGRARLSIGRVGEIPVLDTRQLDAAQLAECEEIFGRFRLREFLPANEAYRDSTRKDLDLAVLCDVLSMPDAILESLDTLRFQWCCEPTVHGGKSTRPDA